MIIGGYIRKVNQIIEASKVNLEARKKKSTQSAKRNHLRFDNSLEISESESAFKDLGLRSREPNVSKNDPDLNFELKDESVIRPASKNTEKPQYKVE